MRKFQSVVSGHDSARINQTRVHFPSKRSPLFGRLSPTAKRAFSQAVASSQKFFDARNGEFFAKFGNV